MLNPFLIDIHSLAFLQNIVGQFKLFNLDETKDLDFIFRTILIGAAEVIILNVNQAEANTILKQVTSY